MYHLALDLKPPGEMRLDEDQGVARIRPLRDTDWDAMLYLFVHSFRESPPYELASDGDLYALGCDALRKTRKRAEGLESEGFVGAFLVTMTGELACTGKGVGMALLAAVTRVHE
jgi:hypothetical protein